MVRILFTNTSYQRQVEHTSLISVVPPLDLASCAALVRERVPRAEVHLLDANVLGLDGVAQAEAIRSLAPDLVVYSAATWAVKRVGEVSRLVDGPKVTQFLIGSHGTALPRRTLAEIPTLDGIVRGEPEETVLEVVEAVLRKENLTGIPGVTCRTGGGIAAGPDRRLLAELDELPLPARDLLPNGRYSSPYSTRVTAIRTTRGCPGRCSFCDSHLLYGCGTRTRHPEAVVAEFADCFKRFGTRYFAIMDHTFTANRGFVQAVCEGLLREGIGRRVRWVCNTRVDMLDDETTSLMRQAGCLQVGIGIESGVDASLAAVGKGITGEQVAAAIARLKRHGIIAMGYAIIGFPEETEESVAETRAKLLAFDPHTLQLSFATPLPGTALWRRAVTEDRLLSEDWDDYRFLRTSVLRGDHLTTEMLRELRDGLVRDFYLRPGKLADLAWFFGFRARVAPGPALRAATKVLRNMTASRRR